MSPAMTMSLSVVDERRTRARGASAGKLEEAGSDMGTESMRSVCRVNVMPVCSQREIAMIASTREAGSEGNH